MEQIRKQEGELRRGRAGLLSRRASVVREACGRLWRGALDAGARMRRATGDEQGQGVAEYVIILAVIVVAAIILAIAFHDKLAAVWQSVTEQLGDLV